MVTGDDLDVDAVSGQGSKGGRRGGPRHVAEPDESDQRKVILVARLACASCSSRPRGVDSSRRRTISGGIAAYSASRQGANAPATPRAGGDAGCPALVVSGAHATASLRLGPLVLQMLNHVPDDRYHVRVVYQIDLMPAFPAGPDQPGQLQLGQVLADRLQ